VHGIVERRAQRMKAQMGDVQAKLSAADAEGGRLRNELYSACMQRDEYKETSELQAGELDTLTKLSSTQRAQLDDLMSKKADLEHQVLVAPQAARGGLAHIAENSNKLLVPWAFEFGFQPERG
jgi:chromosome segregation ATPase